MTNETMIYNAAINAGLFTPEESAAILQSGNRLPLHTYQEWRRMGYQVKTGERAALVIDLWRFGKNVKSKDEEETQESEEHAFLCNAHLFTLQQVEKKQSAKVKTAEEIKAYNSMLAAQRKARAVA